MPEAVDRKQVIDRMRLGGVQTSIHYPPIHRFSYYRAQLGDQLLPRTEEAAAREVTLPLYPTMDAIAIDTVINSVRQALNS